MIEDPFLELLKVICGVLDKLDLPYAITGSVASSLYGEPQTSEDIDICIRLKETETAGLTSALPKRFYLSEVAIVDAARNKSMANLVDMETGLKIDLSVLADEPFYDSVMSRRKRIAFRSDGLAFWTVSPEDIILMKLLWRKDSRSQKQWDNARSVVHIQGHALDINYLRQWAKTLGLSDDLSRLLE